MRHIIILLYATLNEWYRKPLMRFHNGIGLFYVPGFNKLRNFNASARAYAEFIRAKKRVPAYRSFLKEKHFSRPSFSGLIANIHEIPCTNKENYINKFLIEERCVNGFIPLKGVIIDESSGSSGTAVNWARGHKERECNARFIRFGLRTLLGKEPFFIINAFALGPWATGINITMSCEPFSKLKSLGPDKAKIENTILQIGKLQKYIIMGYPPFLKSLADTAGINWKEYDITMVFGGESMSEGMRTYLIEKGVRNVYSSFGASDVELNIGAENDFTISVRKLLFANEKLRKKIIKYGGALPMVFQFNPADFLIHCSDNGELIVTVCRPDYIAPKIRYNLHDKAQIVELKELYAALRELNIDTSALINFKTDLPLLLHYGRADMTVSFFGSNISPNDIQETLYKLPSLVSLVHSFCMHTEEDNRGDKQFIISMELQKNYSVDILQTSNLQTDFFNELATINQDFREAKRMVTVNKQMILIFYPFATGPFENIDNRIKAKYIR
ncbi:MAG: hypothetical protein M3R50_03145 [Bacteroidota bacterium]|nr:hypothetical protein [Bacteroidota bacterium]